ncbi:hypothetical protein BGZ72_008275 [Mortierella alpina]|nr:hypothetical protein BGZ72_008275 [Mortierella alpina]
MGQKGYFGYLKHTLKYEGELLEPADCVWAKWDVDLLGTYYSFIRRNLSEDLTTDPYDLGKRLGYHIRSHFDPSRTTIYMDGRSPDQKAKANAERTKTRVKNLRQIDSLLEKVKKKSVEGKWTAKTTIQSISKKLAAVFRMSSYFTQRFLEGLGSLFPDIVLCDGEADTQIAQSIAVNPKASVAGSDCIRVAVSSDSDLMGYRSVTLLLRKLSGAAGSGFRLFRKDAVLTAIRFEDADQLEALAIVADNDYHKNLDQYGWANNVRIIRAAPSEIRGTLNILDHYVNTVNAERPRTEEPVTRETFQAPTQVFYDLSPSYHDIQCQSNHEEFDSRAALLKEYMDIRDEQRCNRLNVPKKDLDFYVARHSHPNRYRPCFESKDKILNSKVREIDINIPRDTSSNQPQPKKRKNKDVGPVQARTKRAKKTTSGFGLSRRRTEDPGQRRKLKAATRKDHSLRKNWPTRSLTVGSLHASIKRTLNDGQESQATKDVCNVIGEASAQIDELCSIMFEVVALDIDRIMGPKYQVGSSSPAGSSSSSAAPPAQGSLAAPLSLDSSSPNSSQRVPHEVATSLPLQLSQQERSDLLELTGTDPVFFRQLATLILKGSLGAASQYERRRKAPPPRRSSRLHTDGPSSDQPAELAVPHAVRAYHRYMEVVPGFVPLHRRENAMNFQPSVSHLSVDRIHLAVRQLYLGSQFMGLDGEPLTRPKDSVPIEWFFRMNQPTQSYKHYPKSSWTASFALFSEEDLVHILFPVKSTRPVLKSVLGGADTITSFVDTVLNNKGILIQGILYPVGQQFPRRSRPSGYHYKLALQSDPSESKLKLRSVIRTNGFVLHLLAYDTRGERKPSKKDTVSATAAGKSGLYDEDEDDTDFELDAAFLDHDHPTSTLSRPESSSTTSSSDPCTTSANASLTSFAPTSTSRPPKAYDPSKINFARGSKTLTNVEVKFAEPENCPDHKHTRIVGVDLGERITFCATRIGPRTGERTAENEGQRETVSIRRNYLYKPATAFRQQYQDRLQESGLDLVLSRMPSFELGGVVKYIEYTAKHREAILEFYHGRWYMKHSWEASKAQRACYDYGIKAVLGLVGGSEGRKHRERDGPAPVFAVGLGSFDTQTGLPSKHSKMEKLFICKAVSLGYTVVGVHEYFTSAKCPRPDCDNFLISDKNRSRFCTECRIYVDRDQGGSENIAHITLGQVRDQERPKKYKPTQPL